MGDVPPKDNTVPMTDAASVEDTSSDSADAEAQADVLEAAIEETSAPDASDAADAREDSPDRDAVSDAADAADSADARDAGPDGARCDTGLAQWFFRDADKDGHGDPSNRVFACLAPGKDWVTAGDDCHDGNAVVHPGQLNYFSVGYRPANLRPTLSFDYDCNGSETGAPEQGQAPTVCPGVLLCGGSGFDKSDARAEMPGINPYCGSNSITTCMISGLLCQPLSKTTIFYYVCN